MVIAVIALVAALSGVAIAGSGPNADSSASAKKTANKALKKANKAAKAAQSSADSAASAAAAAQTSADTAQTSADSKLGTITRVDGATSPTSTATPKIAPAANCPAGSTLTGGGYQVGGVGTLDVNVTKSGPDTTSWGVVGHDPTSGSWNIKAFSLCAS